MSDTIHHMTNIEGSRTVYRCTHPDCDRIIRFDNGRQEVLEPGDTTAIHNGSLRMFNFTLGID